ncbi:MAG TPA: hypothetical protein VGI43_00590, partial [Mucilaginibacter sp.]
MTETFYTLTENIFQVLFEKSTGSVVLKANPPFFTIIAASDDFLKQNAVKKEEVLGKGFFEAFPDTIDHLHGEISAFDGFVKVVETGERMDIPFLRLDILDPEKGSRVPRYWRCANIPINGEDGKVGYILKNITDITGEIKAQEAKAESENRLLMAAEATGLAIWDLDVSTINFNFSPQLVPIFGHSPETELHLSLIRNQVHPDDLQNIVIKSYFESLETGHFDYEAR